MQLKTPIDAMLIENDRVIASSVLEAGLDIEVDGSAGTSEATGQEYLDVYVSNRLGERMHYRARAADVQRATG